MWDFHYLPARIVFCSQARYNFIVLKGSLIKLHLFQLHLILLLFLFFVDILCAFENSLPEKGKSESESHSVVSDSLWPHGLYSPWDFPDQNTGVGSLSLLQEIFPTQGPNPGLLHCRWILYQLSHHGSWRILEWVAYPSPVNLPNPGIQPGSPALQVDSLPVEVSEKLPKRFFFLNS